MKSRCLATWAILLKFHTIWIVAAVLLSDVVTFLAVNARHCDLWADIRALAGHGDSLLINSSEQGRENTQPTPYTQKWSFLRMILESKLTSESAQNKSPGSK